MEQNMALVPMSQESDLAPYLVQGQSVASRGELKPLEWIRRRGGIRRTIRSTLRSMWGAMRVDEWRGAGT